MSDDRVVFIVLAAGQSRRLGRPKQLVQVDGVSLVRRAAMVAQAAGAPAGATIVVTGADDDAVHRELVGLGVQFAPNPNPAAGIGSSIRTGIAAARELGATAAIILPCDLPRLTREILHSLIDLHRRRGHVAVACDYGKGVIGPPALFASELFEELMSLPDDTGARSVLTRHADELGTTPFPGGLIDIDTEEDVRSQSV